MKAVHTFIRTTELGLALASTYMTAVTLFQTSLYLKLKPFLITGLEFVKSILGRMPIDLGYLDLMLLVLAMILSLLCWRRGDEAGFGRLFSLNMIMFFPAVIDFSMFNWVRLILPYDLAFQVSAYWVLAVGILLQISYLTLRYTVRVRDLRTELLSRGAELEDINLVSKGQMAYISLLVALTAALTAGIYYGVPFVKNLIKIETAGLPYPHIVIGITCTVMIVLATILYLRGAERKPAKKPAEPQVESQDVSEPDVHENKSTD